MLFKHVFAALLLAITLPAHSLNAEEQAPVVPLQQLENNVAGKTTSIADYKGKLIYLDFWASWCGPCRKEMPVLQTFHIKYNTLGVLVWGVNVEQENQAGKDFLVDLNLSFPIFFDSSNTISASYKIEAMPTTVIVGRSGKVRYIFRGYKDGYEQKYAKAIKKLIRE